MSNSTTAEPAAMINHVTTTAGKETTSRRWTLPFLAALVAVLATVGLAGSASPSSSPVAGTRVGAHDLAVEVPVGPPEHIATGQRLRGTGPRVIDAVTTGVAANAVDDVASASNKIYSNRALQRMANEPGPYHNFPGSFDETVFSQGTRTLVPNYFNKAKPNLGNDSIQYRLPGEL